MAKAPQQNVPAAAGERPLRVLIADDHPLFRAGVAMMLKRQKGLAVAAEAADGREAVDLFRRHRPDVALIDLRMPGLDGVGAITAIREESPDAKLVVLTTYDGDEDIYRALRAGAKSYLLKDVTLPELVGCVRGVAEGRRCLPPAVAAKLAERVGASELTGRELEVLRRLAAGLSYKEAAAACSVAEETVKTHVKNLLPKLGASSRAEAVAVALRRGIVRID